MTLYLNGTTGISGVDGSAGTPAIQGSDTNTGISFPAADTIAFNEGGVEAARIDSSGKVGIGNASPTWLLSLKQDSASSASGGYPAVQINNGNAAGYAALYLNDSTAQAGLETRRDTAHLGFYAGGAERMRITSDGRFLVATTTNNPAFNNVQGGQFGALVEASNDDISGRFNRRITDGTIIEFRQDGTNEGSISVSGTTVSYNGAHLSRWSQLPGGATREEILRGTVLSNIDEMCGWGEEENEQLNRMKVSDVEGDPNVAGVFQAWDDDDDTYTDDFYCAMTGDFIIRIAAGVPVHRGQLLMSAGDGTAKPQDDDIIRGKTVAKVTSTHVTCTYDDGSYCVPCVLMAC